MKHTGTKVLETERLLLRPFQMEDAEAMYANWANDPEVTRYLTWPPHPDITLTKQVIADWVRQYDDPSYYQWAICLQNAKNKPIGCIGSVGQNAQIHSVHIGYCLGKKWWHQGIMSEALQTVMEYFFHEVKVNRIESSHDVRNPNSGSVMMKCGMLYEGIARQSGLDMYGKLCDMKRYAILASDYAAAVSEKLK